MKTLSFSKTTVEGQENLETLRALKKHNFLYGFFYFFIFICSVITSGYSSWVAGSILGMILICIIEIIRWVSLQPSNFKLIHFRIGAIVATTFSVITASMGIWLYNTSHNQDVATNAELIENLKQEKQLLEEELRLALNAKKQINDPRPRLTKVLNTTYRVKRWSTTQKLAGFEIKKIKNCGKSDTCLKIRSQILTLEEQLSLVNENNNQIAVKQQRYQEVQNELNGHLKGFTGIAIPIFITIAIMIMLIFAIDYGLWLCGLQIRITKPRLHEYKRAFKVWKIVAKTEKNKKENSKTSLFENAIVPDSVKEKPKEIIIKPSKKKLNTPEKIQQVINAVKNDNGIFTILNVKKHLGALNFGKTAANAKLVIDTHNQMEKEND